MDSLEANLERLVDRFGIEKVRGALNTILKRKGILCWNCGGELHANESHSPLPSRKDFPMCQVIYSGSGDSFFRPT